MRALLKTDFQVIADKGGYMVYYLGHGVEGAGTLSGGKGIKSRAIWKQIHDYRAMGEIEIEGIIIEGEEGIHYKRLCEIDKIVSNY